MRSVRKWISYLLITVMVMMAGGCAEKGSSESETGEALPNESQGKNYSLGVYQDGFAVLSGNGMHTLYLDEDHSYRPLCLKPECSHELDDKTCQAVCWRKKVADGSAIMRVICGLFRLALGKIPICTKRICGGKI